MPAAAAEEHRRAPEQWWEGGREDTLKNRDTSWGDEGFHRVVLMVWVRCW